ncbi:sigma-B regulation protein RsbQ [Paenibacillus cellulosilyticus]|uniref:Sigma-B regulation protein RsbQ n=1 Tax=Paenibacillus cellulosilyticus TaxID=375489 RepID=A0A2V2Z439_9BACL|nr:alpha/beta hydrolase [Paenibacillus cellulosilyticus]PWW05095.1 sigma-B regulation protein RsbQ [Paenibacillus cellulosilyticus]QKS48647.1 alpha/beta hydrolase [Paenibacillus cellulosilyticus]
MTTDLNILERNNVKIFGQGSRPMILAHGFGCDQGMWRHIVPHFERDYRIVLFDYVGSGASQLHHYNPIKYNHLSGYAQDVLEIMDELDLKDAVFVGHSVSSMIGLLAANQESQRFGDFVMIGPSPRYINDLPDYYGGFDRTDIDELLNMMQMNFYGWASYLAPIVMNNTERKELSDELEKTFCSRDPLIARQFAETTFLSDCRGELKHCSIPTLILQCSDDSIAPIEVGNYLHAHLQGSTLRLMNAKGHYPQLSHPEETASFIQQYLTAHH